jgi:hypothetical protein
MIDAGKRLETADTRSAETLWTLVTAEKIMSAGYIQVCLNFRPGSEVFPLSICASRAVFRFKMQYVSKRALQL